MSSTVGSRYATGGVTATNADIEIRKLQFEPSRVVVQNMDNQAKIEWNSALVAGRNVKTIAAGTRSVVASGGLEPLTAVSGSGNPGFKIPAALADINDTTTEELIWEVWE